MKKVVLIGAGGNFYDIYEELVNYNYEVIGYIDKEKQSHIDIKYLGNDDYKINNEILRVITIGGIGKRISIRNNLYRMHKGYAENLVFKANYISKYCDIKPRTGVLIFKNCVIKSKTVIGENTLINSGSVLGHHVKVGNNSQISLGVLIGGNVKIGENCFIGMGASIFQGVTIGDNCIIGANALITKNVNPNCFVVNKDEIKKRF